MLLLYNVSKWSKGLHKYGLTSFSTSAKSFKWPKILKPDRVVRHIKPKSVKIWENMTIWDFAKSMKKDLDFIENVLKPMLGFRYDAANGVINDLELIVEYLKQENVKFEILSPVENNLVVKEKKKKILLVPDAHIKGNEVKRPPVVTIMGHVDHGKTTLLDALRNSNIVAREFGGITQHIGAFSVALTPGKSITFIDTPGHAAFSAMRNRGAEITDIVVLIIAADDGVMQQTIESIKMAKNAGVNILVAVNKIDKAPMDNLVKIKEQLLEEGIQVEDKGGDVQVIPISALKRQNLDKLIEALLLEADMMALTGDPNGPFEGVIIESYMGRAGKFATIIVKRGTLRKKTILLAGQALAKVRSMYNEDGVELSEVTLSQPAQVSGWRDLPKAGEKVIEVLKESNARAIIKEAKKEVLQNSLVKDYQALQEKSVQEVSSYYERKNKIAELKKEKDIEGLKRMFMKKPEYVRQSRCGLDLVIKGDVDGSIDAILNIINTYDSNELCELKVISSGVGSVTDSDVELAEVFDATIYCFNLPYPEKLKSVILEKGIRIRFHNIIYKFIDDLKEEITALLPHKEEEIVVGTAEVLQHFTITDNKKKVPAAGCVCVFGELRKDLFFKISRHGDIIYDGKLKSMKHYKNEVTTIKKDTQCGIMFQDFTKEFRAGDKIICYEKHLKPPLLPWNPGF